MDNWSEESGGPNRAVVYCKRGGLEGVDDVTVGVAWQGWPVAMRELIEGSATTRSESLKEWPGSRSLFVSVQRAAQRHNTPDMA